jgi:hypothetical protein
MTLRQVKMKKKRINQPITVTISPESQEAIEILKKELSSKKVSPVVDSVIKEAMISRGYTQKDTEMLVETSPVTVELVRIPPCGTYEETLVKHAHDGQNFIQAPESGTYVIRLINNSHLRKLVVISVDGRNIMDGESASPDGDGYVLNPWQTWDIKGWRRTDKEVAAFEFVDIEASYDKQMGGSGSNVGVIGVLVFDEVEKWTYWYKKPTVWYNNPYIYDGGFYDAHIIGAPSPINTLYSCDLNVVGAKTNDSIGGGTHSSMSSTKSAAPATVGTGYGQKQTMSTVSTTFNRASSKPSQRITLRYASESMLRKWGVIREPIIPVVNPFPGEKVAVKPPPNWKG